MTELHRRNLPDALGVSTGALVMTGTEGVLAWADDRGTFTERVSPVIAARLGCSDSAAGGR